MQSDPARSPAPRPATPALAFDRIQKSFFGVPVLKEISFQLPAGQTLGLVGENGAGKSTLMNILGGNLAPDAGRIFLQGQPYAPRHPKDAARHGIAFIHQELNLFANLSVAENLFISDLSRWRLPGLPFLRQKAIHAQAAQLLAQVDLHFPTETLVENLSAGECQLVEIAKALSFDARLIILDEPTTSLSTREAERLFAIMKRLRQRGISMIYISHILGDVLRLCDHIVILRDGALVGQGSPDELNTGQLISLMVGRGIQQLYPARTVQPSSEALLEVEHLSQPGMVRDVSFAVHRREVVGLFGLMGAGRSELARIVFGLDPSAQGEIRLHGRPLKQSTPRKRIESGLAFLTENRREEGLCLEASIAENMGLAAWKAYAQNRLKLIDRFQFKEAIARFRAAVRLTPAARDEQAVRTLSGGNQQKVVLAKWLLNKPSMLILDEPTRGIDVGAKWEIYQLINDLAAQGAGLLLISSELEELIGLCDRILVLCQGEIRDCVERRDFDRERILRSALAAPAASPSIPLPESPRASSGHDEAERGGEEIQGRPARNIISKPPPDEG